jgi:phosphatidate cytidylyltransferase
MLQRAISGFFFVLIMVGSIWFSIWTMFVLFTVIAIIALFEFYALRNAVQKGIDKRVLIAAGLIAFFITLLKAPNPIYSGSDAIIHVHSYLMAAQLLTYVLGGAVLLLCVIRDLFDKEFHFVNTSNGLFAAFFIGVPFGLLFHFIQYKGTHQSYSGEYLLYFFILLWTNDTMAYLSGKFLGRHKLWERISPKKTWEGFFGGLVFTILAAFIIRYYAKMELPMVLFLIIPIVVSVFGTLGDLAESHLKRQAGVKDSGNIMPGHGGVLDRFDGILLSVPALFLFLSLILLFFPPL